VLLATIGLLFPPVPIERVAWQPQTAPDHVGAFAANDRLSQLDSISIGNAVGPETIALDREGGLYSSVHSGDVLRISPKTSAVEVWAHNRGRIFGLTWDGQGHIIAADALRGLLIIDRNGQASVLRGSPPLAFINSVAVAKNGKIYFSEATQRFLPREWGDFAGMLDVLEHSATGRVHEYDPATQRDRVIIEHLCFANGVALSADERSLFVAETCEYRVWKVNIDAEHVDAKEPDSGSAKILLKNLPGLPDNITRGLSGRIWVGLVKPRSAILDALSGHPWLRKLIVRLPWSLLLRFSSQGHVFAFDENGTVLFDLQDASGVAPELTGATETADRLYFQSLEGHEIKWLDEQALNSEGARVPRR
jgi:sugar lactone lactonase YvrE